MTAGGYSPTVAIAGHLGKIATSLETIANQGDSAKIKQQRDFMGGQAAKARRLLIETAILLEEANDTQDQFDKARKLRALPIAFRQYAESIELPEFDD